MVKKIKEYLVFTSRAYRIVMLAVLPIVFVLLYVASTWAAGGAMIFLVPVLSVLAEIIGDYWMFGGIQNREAAKIDFLKTSQKGMKLLETALAGDLIRRLLSLLAIMGICLLYNVSLGIRTYIGGPAGALCLILAAYILSVIGTLLTRFGDMFQINLLVGNVGVFLQSIYSSFWFTTEKQPAAQFALAVLAVLAVGVSILAVRTAMGRVKGGFRDDK